MKPHWLVPSRSSRRALVIVAAWVPVAAPPTTQTVSRALTVRGVVRTYRLHIPPGLPRDGTAGEGGGPGAGR
jgi:hypothetical protein